MGIPAETLKKADSWERGPLLDLESYVLKPASAFNLGPLQLRRKRLEHRR